MERGGARKREGGYRERGGGGLIRLYIYGISPPSCSPNYVSFDGYFYENDFPNMSNVVLSQWMGGGGRGGGGGGGEGSDLAVNKSGTNLFLSHRSGWVHINIDFIM